MRAAVLFETGQPLKVVNNVIVPELIEGQVRVKMLYAGLCHSQLAEVRGHRGEDKFLPHMLGHEGVGEVVSVGENVSKVTVGDKVVLGWIKGNGLDAKGALYKWNDLTINSGGVTVFSDETVVSENRVVRLPDGIPDKLAVLLGCALPTGMGLVFNESTLSAGQTVCVVGLGGVGLSALIAASSKQPSLLIAIDVEAHKLELAKELGATHCVNLSDNNAHNRLKEICPDGVDFSFEAGGTAKSIELAFDLIRENGGQCIFASHPKQGEKIELEPHAFHRGKNIKGSWGGSSRPDTDIPKLVNLYKEQKLLNIEKLLSKEYPLTKINDALDDLEARTINRALITFEMS